MNNKFPNEIGQYYKPDLAIKIAKELGHIPTGDPDFERGCPNYDVTDIFNILPSSITYNGHRGDLAVTSVDISYFSVSSDWKHVLVHFETIPTSGDIYDAFYKMILWLKENNLLNEGRN